jgi:hypothetical protein
MGFFPCAIAGAAVAVNPNSALPTMWRRVNKIGRHPSSSFRPQSSQRSLPDFCVELPGGMVLNQLRQGRFEKLGQNVAQFGGFRFAGRERRPINPSKRTDQCVAVLAADLAILVAVAVVGDHGKSFNESAPVGGAYRLLPRTAMAVHPLQTRGDSLSEAHRARLQCGMRNPAPACGREPFVYFSG